MGAKAFQEVMGKNILGSSNKAPFKNKKQKLLDCNMLVTNFLCFLQWFLANLSYQEALSDTQVAIVNILSSTSGDKSVTTNLVAPELGALRTFLKKA